MTFVAVVGSKLALCFVVLTIEQEEVVEDLITR